MIIIDQNYPIFNQVEKQQAWIDYNNDGVFDNTTVLMPQ